MTEQVSFQDQNEIQRQVLLDYNPASLAQTMQDMIVDGWVIDPDRPFAQWGFSWEVGMIRAGAQEEGKPKLSRAEILAKAREAKAARAKEKAGE